MILTRRSELPILDGLRRTRPRLVAPTVRRDTGPTFTTVDDLAGLETLRAEWSALFEACGRPHQVFQTVEWLAIWAGLYVDARTKLSIVTGRIGGRLVLVWPLVVRTNLGLRLLSGMGEPLSQYSDALIAAELGDAGEDAAFAYVMDLPVDVLSFRRVRDDAAIAPLLHRHLGVCSNRQTAPVVDFGGAKTTEAFEKRFSSKLRSSRRRRRRRLEERGAVAFGSPTSSEEAAACVAIALSFKREWARKAGIISPALRDPRFERFFVAAALAKRDAPDLRVSALRCGSDIVGISLSVACKGQLFGHVLAPRTDFETPGLGAVLAEATIIDALEHGYSAFDTLAPADPYKLEWTSASVGVGDYIASRGLIGSLYSRLWLRFGREAMKTVARRLHPALKALSRRRPRARHVRQTGR